MIKHTPGPWTVEPDYNADGFWSIWHDANGAGAELAGRIGEEANANLIAAAPDLLTALRTLVPLADKAIDRAKAAEVNPLVEAVEAARAAIAKAEGRS